MLIHLTRDGLTCGPDVDALIPQFEQQHALRLPQLFDAELLRLIATRIELGRWVARDHGPVGRDLCLDSVTALGGLLFVANTPAFLKLIERITQCGSIVRFDGRVYRMASGTDHHDNWHNDVTGDRLVGMSVNLGARPYTGGVFSLRRKGSAEILCELPNTVPGDAILFRISPQLEHRVTTVEGAEPKTAFAGWFMSGGTDLFAAMRERSVGPGW